MHKEAEELLLNVMHTRNRILGKGHPDTQSSKAHLAAMYWSQGHLTKAEELQCQVVETQETMLGEKHPKILESRTSLAGIYWNQNRYVDAVMLLNNVTICRNEVFGPGDPDTIRLDELLCCWCREQS